MSATEKRKQELDGIIKKLEQLPDIGHALRMHRDETRLLSEKLDSYKHDLEPFHQKLKSEFVYASRAQQRQSMQSVQVHNLPPQFYWDKMEQFQIQMSELRKQLQSLHQHLKDSINNPQPAEVISTKSVANVLNASRRTTLNIAAQVISNHEQIQKLKAEYKKYRLQHFGDSHDPFQDAKEKEKQRQQKIQQYLNDQSDGLQMSGFQLMGNNNANNNNGNNNIFGNNNNGNNNGTNFTFGNGNSGNNANNNNSGNNNSNNNNSGFSSGWGSGAGGTGTSWGNSGNNSSSNNSGNNSGFAGFGTSTTGNSGNNSSSNNSGSTSGWGFGTSSTGNSGNNSTSSNNSGSTSGWGSFGNTSTGTTSSWNF